MKPLLIITKRQFGHHTNYYKYCALLKNEFKITFVCFDTGLEKIEMPNVKIKYIPWKGNKIFRGVYFLFVSLFHIARFKGVIYVNHFDKCHLLKKIFPRKKMILDIRTLSVSRNKSIRKQEDTRLEKDCKLFDHTTPISKGVQKKLNLTEEKSTIIPLGSDSISLKDKYFKSLTLLYVGTLNGRNIDQTILGLSYFIKKNPDFKIFYNIIGDGNELKDLKNLVSELNLSDTIKLHGRIPHNKLQPFFDNSNVGVSFIPMTEYYDFQPPTKTFEYIMSGMPCVATNTSENKALITSENGVLCNDNPKSFAKALDAIAENNQKYNSAMIRKTLKEFEWQNIVTKRLKPVLNKVI